jgi:hypothetical protein
MRATVCYGGVAVEPEPKEIKMPVDTTDLDPEIKAKIDGMSREELEQELRNEDPTSELRQGVAGEYFEERYLGASGLTVDDFNREERLKREEEDEEGDQEDEGDQEEEPVED